MEEIRTIKNYSLNKGLMGYNVTDKKQLGNGDKGVSVWLDSETVEHLKKCSKKAFLESCKELTNT